MNITDRMTAAEYQAFLTTGRLPARLCTNQAEAPKPNKYRNVRTEYKGTVYDSKKEARRAAEIDLMKQSGEVVLCMEQIAVRLPGCIYRPDFILLYADGTWAMEDVKGIRTKEYKLKKKLVKETYGIDIVEV